MGEFCRAFGPPPMILSFAFTCPNTGRRAGTPTTGAAYRERSFCCIMVPRSISKPETLIPRFAKSCCASRGAKGIETSLPTIVLPSPRARPSMISQGSARGAVRVFDALCTCAREHPTHIIEFQSA